MKSKSATQVNIGRGVGVFALVLFAALLLPYASLMLKTDIGFFVPQYLFPYDDLQRVGNQTPSLVFGKELGTALNAAQWIVVGAGFGVITRRAPLRTVTWQAVATVAGVCALMMVLFRLLDVRIAFDAL